MGADDEAQSCRQALGSDSHDSTRIEALVEHKLLQDKRVKIGNCVVIDDKVVLRGNVVLEDGCRIGYGSLLLGDTRDSSSPLVVGPNARVGPGCIIRARSHPITLEAEVSLGPYCIINYDNKDPLFPTGPVRIGAGTRVGACTFMGNHIDIDPLNSIGPFTRLEYHVTLGPENRLKSCMLGLDPQDVTFYAELEERETKGRREDTTTPTYTKIGAKNIFREGVRISRGTNKNPDRTTHVGDHNFVMDHTHIGHDCRIGDHTKITTGCKLAGHVQLDDFAVLAGSVKIKPFIHIGRAAYVIGNSGVADDVYPFFISEGADSRARVTAVPNYAGINEMLRKTRDTFTEDACEELKERLKLMSTYLKATEGEDRDKAWDAILSDMQKSDYVQEWVDFVTASKKRKDDRKPAFKRSLTPFGIPQNK